MNGISLAQFINCTVLIQLFILGNLKCDLIDIKRCFGFSDVWISNGHPEKATVPLSECQQGKVVVIEAVSFMRPKPNGDRCFVGTECCRLDTSSICKADAKNSFPQIYTNIKSECDGHPSCNVIIPPVEMDSVCEVDGQYVCNSTLRNIIAVQNGGDDGQRNKHYDFWCWARKVEITYSCVDSDKFTTLSPPVKITSEQTKSSRISPTTTAATTTTSTSTTTTTITKEPTSSTTPQTTPKVTMATTKSTTITDPPTPSSTTQLVNTTVTTTTNSPTTVVVIAKDTDRVAIATDFIPWLQPETTHKTIGEVFKHIDSSNDDAAIPVEDEQDILPDRTTISQENVSTAAGKWVKTNRDLDGEGNPIYIELEPTKPQKKDNNTKFIALVAGASVVALIAVCAVTIIIHILLRRRGSKMTRNSSLKQTPRDNAAIMKTITTLRNRENSTGSEQKYVDAHKLTNSCYGDIPVTHDLLTFDRNSRLGSLTHAQVQARNTNGCEMVDNTYYESEDVFNPRPGPDTKKAISDLIISNYTIKQPVQKTQPTSDPFYYELCEDAANQGKFCSNNNPINKGVDSDDYYQSSDDYQSSKSSVDNPERFNNKSVCVNMHEYSGDDEDYYESSEDEQQPTGQSQVQHINNKPQCVQQDKSMDYDYAYDHFQFEGRVRSK